MQEFVKCRTMHSMKSKKFVAHLKLKRVQNNTWTAFKEKTFPSKPTANYQKSANWLQENFSYLQLQIKEIFKAKSGQPSLTLQQIISESFEFKVVQLLVYYLKIVLTALKNHQVVLSSLQHTHLGIICKKISIIAITSLPTWSFKIHPLNIYSSSFQLYEHSLLQRVPVPKSHVN